MADGRSGLSGALREAIEDADPLLDDDHIEDMFGDAPDQGSPVSASAFSLGLPDPVQRRDASKGGRPKGAQNITTRRIIEYLQARYRHPLLGMADIAATSPADLAKLVVPRDPETGEPLKGADGKHYKLSKADLQWAFEFWFRVSSELTEYMATKQPRQIAGLEDLAPLFVMNLGEHQGSGMTVIQHPLGLPKTPMNTGDDEAEDAQVPCDEVPQTVQPAVLAGDQEPSDD